jgi:hypothetical protein
MFFVGDRALPHGGETEAYAATTAASLRAIGESPERRTRALLELEDAAPVVLSPPGSADAAIGADAEGAWTPLTRPSWRALPIAVTALQDFAHCPRRFELAHVLDLPERAGALLEPVERDEIADGESGSLLDARAEGALAHRVLEQVDVASFGALLLARAEASRVLERAGVSSGHPHHEVVLARVLRFLSGAYAARIAAQRGEVAREVPFVLDLRDAEDRSVTLRGTIDLLVRWRDGTVDLVDYKRARSASAQVHGLVLDAYALAARALFPATAKLRVGVVFLRGGGEEPIWRPEVETGPEVSARIASLGARLVEARWSERFSREPLATCARIRCGYVPHCHPDAHPEAIARASSAETD